ncbi:MAG TPA: cytochrome c [Thermoanaerobaculia bacterium]|nr:cytochrome c [Thermoanaerobaculia bacterium]
MSRNTTAVLLALIVMLAAVPSFAASDGAALFKSKCAVCHGEDGSGNTKMGKTMKLRPLGSPEVQKQTDKELYAWTAEGKGKMPAYKNKLSEEDINALVAFMRTLAK